MPNPLIKVRKINVPVSKGTALQDSLDFVEEQLKKLGVAKKLLMRSLLISEEMITEFVEHASENAKLAVKVRHFMGSTTVTLHCAGRQIEPFESIMGSERSEEDTEEDISQKSIRAVLLKSMGEKLKYSFINGVNNARIEVGQSEKRAFLLCCVALVLGAAAGLLMRFVFPAPISEGLSYYALDPIKTIFMNCLNLIVGPVVFFSIISSFSQFKSLSEFGKIGGKVMGTYMITTLFALGIATVLVLTIQPGEPGFASYIVGSNAEVGEVDLATDTSVRSMLINIVPGNLFRPFLEANTLQIIFLAVIFGIAVGTIGEYSGMLKSFFEACNSLFLAITNFFIRLMPVAIFAAVTLMVTQMDSGAGLLVLIYFGMLVAAIMTMMLVYGLMVFIIGRLNPFVFYRKAMEGMVTSFSLQSSLAAMPTNIKCCNKMGISPKISSFSIPLGATINMDGFSVWLMITAFFLARAVGVEIPTSSLASMIITSMLLSFGCPGVPGAGLVCIGVLLNAAGIPFESIALIIGIISFCDMFVTMSNATGDVATTLIVARSEKLVDLDVYYDCKKEA